jgi:copper chaperone
MQLKVPTIVCTGCVDRITEELKIEDPDVKVDVDMDAKTVKVETAMSEESVRQSITSVGHSVE